MPMPDAEYQGVIFRAVVTPLYHYVTGIRPDAHVAGNTFVYYEQGNPRRFVSPDCYAVFGVEVSHIFYRNTYQGVGDGEAAGLCVGDCLRKYRRPRRAGQAGPVRQHRHR